MNQNLMDCIFLIKLFFFYFFSEHLHASFVPNTLIYGNSTEANNVKGNVSDDPWGRPIDGSWEAKGFNSSWDEDNHHHEAIKEDSFEYSQNGWFEEGNEIIEEEDNFIKNDNGGWGEFINQSNIEQQRYVNEGILVNKYENGQQQNNLFTGRDNGIYRGGNEGGRVYFEMSGINFSDMMAHIKFGISH
ncbi:hypothetical protein Mgra_00002547 [Meloidogyne graminicola]|uniref:Uncharacterized protein n=1 Tax=Meloidogyne graminicola TaxID=189291 RepID=A0A8S9ZYJ7_9BILA|nr:hypothetical protein Mgra_00002547 [Meloidogyne graminicola]